MISKQQMDAFGNTLLDIVERTDKLLQAEINRMKEGINEEDWASFDLNTRKVWVSLLESRINTQALLLQLHSFKNAGASRYGTRSAV